MLFCKGLHLLHELSFFRVQKGNITKTKTNKQKVFKLPTFGASYIYDDLYRTSNVYPPPSPPSKNKELSSLKGQCHEDFAVLDQFWAKIITLRLYSLTKCFCKAPTKISMNFIREANHNKVLEDFFEDVASKVEKTGNFFQISIHFHPK